MTIPLLPHTERALLEERAAVVAELRARADELEALGPEAFLKEHGLNNNTVRSPVLAYAMMRRTWTDIRYDAPNNHWYASSPGFERRVTGLEVAEVLNRMPPKETPP